MQINSSKNYNWSILVAIVTILFTSGYHSNPTMKTFHYNAIIGCIGPSLVHDQLLEKHVQRKLIYPFPQINLF